MMPAAAERYQAAALRALPRLLNLLDRNPASPTFGCFDRSYWLHRKTDFPSSTAQMSALTLTRLYKTDFGGNPLFGRKVARDWSLAAIAFALRIQHADGSFDEWYPNERGWAGPTGYVANALMESILLLGDEVPDALKASAERGLKNAAAHLARRDEGDTLANHHAIALLPLSRIAAAYGDDELAGAASVWRSRFRALLRREGWAVEYDGCDLGYSLGTLNFLADIHRMEKAAYLEEFARKSFRFLSHFAYPDGGWAGSLGSRHTLQPYPYALEYWAGVMEEARPLLKHFRGHMAGKLEPADQEDHYLHYRLAEYLKAAECCFSGSLEEERLPYEQVSFTRASFPESGFLVEKGARLILWAALKRGGACRVHCAETGRLLQINNGCLVEGSGGEVSTSLWQGSDARDSGATGPLFSLFTRRFRPFTFWLFRGACLLMEHPWLAYLFKRVIRKRMITGQKPLGSRWIREFRWEGDSLLIADRLEWREKKPWKRIFWGGEFHTRYVPQGHYFSAEEADFPPREFRPGDFVDPGRPVVEWKINPGGSGLCAR